MTKKDIYQRAFEFVILGSILGLGFFFMRKTTNDRIDEFFKEYPLLTKEDSLNGTILEKIPTPDGLRKWGAISVVLDNGNKYRIPASNEIQTGRYFLTNATEGAELLKKKYNDTISMTKLEYGDTITYKFLLK